MKTMEQRFWEKVNKEGPQPDPKYGCFGISRSHVHYIQSGKLWAGVLS
jgi:hypothetical protein